MGQNYNASIFNWAQLRENMSERSLRPLFFSGNISTPFFSHKTVRPISSKKQFRRSILCSQCIYHTRINTPESPNSCPVRPLIKSAGYDRCLIRNFRAPSIKVQNLVLFAQFLAKTTFWYSFFQNRRFAYFRAPVTKLPKFQY